jgi:hypothetical protein
MISFGFLSRRPFPATPLQRASFLLVFCVGSIYAQSNVLPLADSNEWILRSPYVSTPVTMRVESDSVLPGGKRRISLLSTNMWGSYSYVLTIGSSGPILEGITSNGATTHFIDPLSWFGTNMASNTPWITPFGTMTLVSKTDTVETATKTYVNCWHYQVSSDTSVQDWWLAPNVGFVQFGTGPAAFVLDTVTLNTYVAPVSTSRPVACPTVGMDANPAANTDFSSTAQTAALQKVLSAGARMMRYSARWSDIETAPGVYSLTALQNAIGFAATNHLSLAVTLRPIDSNQIAMPVDLAGRALDDPLVVSRFQAMLRALAAEFNSSVKWVHLGNEVNIYLSLNPSATSSFLTLYNAGASTLKSINSSISVGVTFSYSAYWYNNTAFLAVSPVCDHIAFTHYPVRPDFTVYDPGAAKSDFGEMISAANGKPVIITEIGYPSSATSGASAAAQEAYFSNVFDALQTLGGYVTAANFFQLSDMPTATVNHLVNYYGDSDPAAFGGYLGTLGVVDATGANKPAWSTFSSRANTFLGSVCTTP